MPRIKDSKGSDYVFKKIYGLLKQTIDEYVGTGTEKPRVQPLDVLSMAGRALFFRFLVDRKIVFANELQDICPAADGLKDTFATAEKAAQTSAWLDETFNGDFLQLIDESIPATNRAARQEAYLRFYRRTEQRAGRRFFNHLHAILNGWRATGAGMQMELDWGDLDFAHIPVGVLSQVYESFSHRADHRSARETSIHYTPRTIARLMVDQTFAAAKDPAEAKVLDPACGAGIFLVLAFRRLVSERWRSDGKRPNTKTIQDILYNQVRGFEISESALRLAALALYITAIEVNGTQRPPKALKFPRGLRDEVLFYFGDGQSTVATKEESQRKSSFTLGSLGPHAAGKFDGLFDIVIGNPPWTRLREEERQRTEEKIAAKTAAKTATDVLNEEFTKIGRRVLRERGLSELAGHYENPDKNPDLPFVWRATEWAKRDDGIIAFALPARIFGRTAGKGFEAWRAILRSISITGLINGADLRKTAVEDALQTARDTLFAAAAYRRQGSAALERTMRRHRDPFRAELSNALEPYFEVCGEEVLVDEPPDQLDTWEQPWFFLAISRAKEPVPVNANLLRKAMKEANKRSASRIIVKAHGRRGLLLGLLNQRRWWTITRARLCGQHIVRHHLEAFGLTQQA